MEASSPGVGLLGSASLEFRTRLGRWIVGDDMTLRLAGLFAAILTSIAHAQWLEYSNETDARWIVSSELHYDVSEKSGAVADLDLDGDPDIVIVRMRAWGATNIPANGMRTALLMMNENGVFHDRTALYASTSDVPGDMGMLQPAHNRDVVIADVNVDGLPDVVTATAWGHAFAKSISHPRIYINLGVDGAGNWLGLRYEGFRFPQLMVGATAVAPRFSAVAAGDIDDDGDPDLWFSDFDNSGNGELPNQPAGHDLGHTLMINLGGLQGGVVGTFRDDTDERVPVNMAMTGVDYGTDADMQDLNGDGRLELVVLSTLGSGPRRLQAGYNDPSNPGFVATTSNVISGQAPYTMSWGDLNLDGRQDVVVDDNGTDYYILNTGTTGTPPNEVSTWSQHPLPPSTNGFGGDITLADLDLDDDLDILLTRVAIDISGCNNGGGSKILHNNLSEGAQESQLFTDGTPEVLVDGAAPSLVGFNAGHDVLVLDVNSDGAPDIVWLNGCSGSHTPGSGDQRAFQVWIAAGLAVPCPGDVDEDGDVDLGDLGVLLSAYQADDAGDLDGDGDTDLSDLGILLSAFGQPCP